MLLADENRENHNLERNKMHEGGAGPSHDIPLVNAVAGDNAFVPCNVTMPLADDEASLILWYRIGVPNPIYTLDVRNVPITKARHFPSTELEGRINFDLEVHPPVLVFSPVQKADEADYKCRVDLRRSRTLILQIRLHVLVPPDEPIIMDEDGQRLQGTIGPYDEGSSITFICDVDGGDPSPSLTWWRDGILVDDDFIVTTKGFVRNKLRQNKIQRLDLMAEYFCKASNTNLTKPKTASIQLDINLLPLDVKIIGANLPLLADEKYDLVCKTSGSKPIAITSWWLNGEKITTRTNEIVDETDNSTINTLQIVPTPTDNGKVLTCKSANPAIMKSTIETSIFLDVHFPPEINLTRNTSTEGVDVKEGENILLNCTIKANPQIFKVTWLFDQSFLTTNERLGIFIDNQTMLLKEARKEHTGKYRCSAENSIDRGISNTLHMVVRFAPKCRFPGLQTLVLTDTDPLNVTCDVEANPYETDFRWSLDNPLGSITFQNWSNSSSWNSYSYSPQNKDGYEVLSCWARNSVGVQHMPCQFKLITASIPDAPQGCVVTNITLHSFSLECEAGYNGSLKQEFHLEVYSSLKEYLEYNLTETVRANFMVNSLSPGTSYSLVIYASNAKGRSNYVSLSTTTLSPPERRTAEEDSKYVKLMLRILTGVVVFFTGTLSLIGVFILIRKLKQSGHKGPSEEDDAKNCDNIKKDLHESPDANKKGPDIIPQSTESDVFFLSGKTVEAPILSILETSPSKQGLRKYKHTVL